MFCCVTHSYQLAAWYPQLGVSNVLQTVMFQRELKDFSWYKFLFQCSWANWPLPSILLCKPETYKFLLMYLLPYPPSPIHYPSIDLFPQAITLAQHTFISCLFFHHNSYSAPPQPKKVFQNANWVMLPTTHLFKHCNGFPRKKMIVIFKSPDVLTFVYLFKFILLWCFPFPLYIPTATGS